MKSLQMNSNKLKEFSNYIISLGATIPDNAYSPYEFRIETIYGTYRVSIHESDFTSQGFPKKHFDNLVSIYTSFVDFDRCKDYLINVKGEKFPTNSKVNYHLCGGDSAEENWDTNFERFKSDLEKILIKKENKP